jgi:hypothetical protein
MTLLEKLEQVITELEKKEKKTYYRPKKSTIENIQTRIVPDLDYYVRTTFKDIRDNHRIMIRELYQKMTGISFDKIREMEKETKENVLEAILKRLDTMKISDREFVQFFGQNAYRYNERIRLLLKGVDLTKKRGITEEEEKELLLIYKRIIELSLRETMFDEKMRLDIVKEITRYYEFHDHKVTTYDNFFNEFLLKQFASYEAKEVMVYVKKWYKQTNQTLGKEALKNPTITYFNIVNYMYLFPKEEKKKWQEKFRTIFQKQFEQYMSMKQKDLESLKSLKERVEKVEGWV